MILEYVTTHAFLYILSAKYQLSVRNFTKKLVLTGAKGSNQITLTLSGPGRGAQRPG